ncbi:MULTISPECIES: DUF2510 domain-containing protein [unclassified Agrococcus]|uniref:DUF2510 domain-containing protein n=1 Tax=unclassified Agrococcus TaxID=2615065 RepID=UPI003614C460
MSTTPAGWYPDPEREGATRWWDGSQWAPSQEPAATDDRFRPRDDADGAASSGEGDWSPTPFESFSPSAASGQQAGDGAAASAPSDAAASDASSTWQQPGSAPAWGTASTPAAEPSWNQPAASAPAWGQQDASAPAWGQGSTPQQGGPQDFGQTGTQQQWNQYGQSPQPAKKSRTGLFIGIGAGVLVLLLVIGGLGIWAATSLLGGAQTQTQTQGGGGGTGGGGAQGTGTYEVTVGANGQSVTEIEITTAGQYQIDVVPTNDGDPRIELTGNGQSWSDDDSGDATWASRLNEYLDVGTYTLMVEEYSGDPLVATVTVAQG